MLSKKTIIVFAVFLTVLCGCDRKAGQFAYKSMEMDMFRKFVSGMEFDSRYKINWIYVLKKVSGERKIGVVLLQKDLSWIEVDKYMYVVKPSQKNVYGHFQYLEPAHYKIVILENNIEIESVEFDIYFGEE